MLRGLVIAAAMVSLTGCDIASDTADNLARQQARTVVNGVVADRFPGVDATPVTDCVIDSASSGEILSLARASILGVNDQTIDTVLDIVTRPTTVSCIANNGLGGLL